MNLFLQSVILLSAVGFIKSDNPPPHKDDRCPKVDGGDPVYLPHETDCHLYYECGDGYAYQFSCPGDLVFNPNSNVCDKPKNVDCKSSASKFLTEEVNDEADEENTNPPPHKDDRCPKVDPAEPVYLPHETDCHKYYECGDGYAYEFSCPGNLLFNTNLNICDDPENVDCKNSSSKLLTVNEDAEEEENTNPPPHKDDRCPKVDPAEPVYLPHETDCHKYYECGDGYAYEFSCPGNLLFNTNGNICDNPENVKCNASIPKLLSINEDAEEEEEENTNPPPHKDDRCPKVDPAEPVYLPHETDCHKYYECGDGYAYEFSCPGNLLFNTNLNICDDPENVDCKNSSSELLTVNEDAEEEENTNPPPHKDDRCPQVDPTEPVYLPHETDCHKYYECGDGYAYEFSCPGNLLFNTNGNICDNPENVDCNTSIPKLLSINEDAEEEEENTNPPPHKDDRCPQVDPAEPVYLPHETDCHKYYECGDGYAYEFSCPGNLLFNTNGNICDNPENVECNTSIPKLLSINEDAEEEEENTNPPPHKDDRCPQVDPAEPVYLPHETDCHKYYECGDGYAYEFSCPGDLLFNTNGNICDNPENVDCKTSVSI